MRECKMASMSASWSDGWMDASEFHSVAWKVSLDDERNVQQSHEWKEEEKEKKTEVIG